MARKLVQQRRDIRPDPRYGSRDVTKFVNVLMEDGKKSRSEGIFYEAMRLIEERTGQPALNVFEQALSNTRPVLEVRSRRVGGATYQVPMEVTGSRRDSLARRWIVDFARNRSEQTMAERLAGELLDASNGEGGAVRRKEEIHRMAEANKAFAHYRW